MKKIDIIIIKICLVASNSVNYGVTCGGPSSSESSSPGNGGCSDSQE